MRWLLWSVGGLVALLGVGLYVALHLHSVQDALFESGLKAGVASAAQDGGALFEDDAMHGLVCGSASPLPHKTRKRPCIAIFAGGKFYVVDTGPGTYANLANWRIQSGRLGAVFLTHFHSDHIGELGEFNMQSWIGGRPGPLDVYGPVGIDRVVDGFNRAYELDRVYRTAHHGEEVAPPGIAHMVPRTISGVGASQDWRAVVLDDGDLKVTAFSVSHSPVEPAIGYRFDYKGRSIVVSGDTIRSQNLLRTSVGADVIFHEAQAQHMVAKMRDAVGAAGNTRLEKILSDIPDYHTSPVEAAEVANSAGARLLVLYHLTPPPQNFVLERVFTRGVDEARDGDWVLSDDGTLITLPIGSTEIEVGSIN